MDVSQMLFQVPGVLVVLVLVLGAFSYDDDDDDYQEYEGYDDDEETSTTPTSEGFTINRIRRYGAEDALKTLSPEDVREVRGALKQLFSGMTLENPFTPHVTSQTGGTSTVSTTYDPSYNYTSPKTSTYMTDLLTEIIKITDHERGDDKQLRRKNWTELDDTKWTPPTTTQNTTAMTLSGGDSTPQNTNASVRKQELDLPRLLAIISELASEFESNLTRKLNDTLVNMTLPTCSTPTALPRVTSEYDANYTGSVIAKCFVCGLSTPAIPQNAHCADAFAGDFLPLVPVDPTAKGKISRFKKYCQYSNVPGYQLNASQPRVILGRWTGGCAVRWIDLSGVYTQRTCRNRLQPTMGLHFGSKRMAKLERSLWNVENGCIISPMATLVPLSRGISLYARFHACVCTGSWCNITHHLHLQHLQHWITILLVMMRIT
ncbi:unnamed protein product [Danaus chrysippus]|uniref:(African queen) hypothetical protein n=1 Tax=Danaus chrysippus TaxID=151541 RepID=A0A8J2QWI7_9NEOP|nr:unnamed protein product [Danaus chrysippus]